MGWSKKDVRKLIVPNLVGFETRTETLDIGGTTVEIVELATVASKVTVQSSGTLAYDWEVSINGEDFVAVGSVAAGAFASYNTHNVASVRITATAGTGKVSIACVS